MEVRVLSVRRTGKVFSIASSEFEVVLSTGEVKYLWSPPWHDFSPEQEEELTRKEAKKRWEKVS